MTLEPARTVAELQELRSMTGIPTALSASVGRRRGPTPGAGCRKSSPHCRSTSKPTRPATSGQLCTASLNAPS